MAAPDKFCSACRHRWVTWPWPFGKSLCEYGRVTKFDLVSGNVLEKRPDLLCKDARADVNLCGPVGRYHLPHPVKGISSVGGITEELLRRSK